MGKSRQNQAEGKKHLAKSGGRSGTGSAADSGAGAGSTGIALYHDMRVEENFTKCANRIFSVLQKAAAMKPGTPRYLYLDVQGHRNAAGGFDADAFEIIHDFLLKVLSPYLTEISTPLYRIKNPEPQREDIPDVLHIEDPQREHAYDQRELITRNRDHNPDKRRSRPSVQAIAKYLGLDEPICPICWQTPVERAHVVPQSLGGSNDVRNFALLCPRHHREAPDVADSEAFWSWVDYACDRDGHMKWEGVDTDLLERAERVGLRLDKVGPIRKSVHHFDRVRDELARHYGWAPADFTGGEHWGALMKEFHTVLETATSTHFNVAKKASTEAWAFEVARRRLRDVATEKQGTSAAPAVSADPAVGLAERTAFKSPGSEDARRLTDAARRADTAAEAVALVREIISSGSVSSAEDVLRSLGEETADRAAQLGRLSDELMEHAICRYCGHSVARVGTSLWRHDAAVPMSRGCRAASFDRDGHWDNELDRTWKAAPPKSPR